MPLGLLPAGRNDQLNRSGFNVGQLLDSGGLSEHDVAARFEDAASRSGLIEDDGLTSVQRTIRSGLDAGKAEPREIPASRMLMQGAQAKHVDPETGEVLAKHQVDVQNHSRNGFHSHVTDVYQDDLPPIVTTNRALRDISPRRSALIARPLSSSPATAPSAR